MGQDHTSSVLGTPTVHSASGFRTDGIDTVRLSLTEVYPRQYCFAELTFRASYLSVCSQVSRGLSKNRDNFASLFCIRPSLSIFLPARGPPFLLTIPKPAYSSLPPSLDQESSGPVTSILTEFLGSAARQLCFSLERKNSLMLNTEVKAFVP